MDADSGFPFPPGPTDEQGARVGEAAAVIAAYGWPADLAETEILERLLALNLVRAREPAPDDLPGT